MRAYVQVDHIDDIPALSKLTGLNEEWLRSIYKSNLSHGYSIIVFELTEEQLIIVPRGTFRIQVG